MYNKEVNIGTGLVAYKYKYFLDKEHPLASKPDGIVLLHRHIVSIKLGRWIRSEEHVHHLDENSLNNHPDNLVVLTKQEHGKLHNSPMQEDRQCVFCKNLFTVIVTSDQVYCSNKCRGLDSVKDKAITKEALEELMPFNTWTSLGELFNYTDNGIKKRAKALGCDCSLIRTKRKTGSKH